MHWNAAKLSTLPLYPLIPQQTVDHVSLKTISQYSQGFTYLTVRRRLTTGLRFVLTQTQMVQYSLLHTWAIWYSLLLLGYKPVQHVTVLKTVGNLTQY